MTWPSRQAKCILPALFFFLLESVVTHVLRALLFLSWGCGKIFQLTGGVAKFFVGGVSIEPFLTCETLPEPVQEPVGCEAEDSEDGIGFKDAALGGTGHF